jgi:16S rRNA processing protein RimM
MKKLLATAKILKPYGVDGYLRLESFSGETRHLLKLKKVELEGEKERKRFSIEDAVLNGNSVLIKLEGIETPEEARRYSNWTVWVDRRKAAARKRKEYYASDLAGCALVIRKEVVGKVESVTDSASTAFLEVSDKNGESFLLPFTNRNFGKVDLKRKEIELKSDWGRE